MIFVSKILVVMSTAFVMALQTAQPLLAQERPLLVDGRQTVYQRVLTRPEAQLHIAPGQVATQTFPPFQPLYVFGREPGWVQVGRSVSSAPDGWVQAGSVIPWRQNIVGAFTNPAGRERSLMFDTEDQLRWFLNHEARREMQARLITSTDAETLDSTYGIASIEPGEFIDISERFYLMPILDFVEDFHPDNYEPNLLMEVATLPLNAEQPTATPGRLDAGIVFVFDTTQSMDPFIASTQQAVEQIVRRIEGTDIGERTNFGVVAFRDNNAAAPGLEYRTRVLLPLERRNDQTPVIATIRAATEVAVVSSPGFNEDSVAGVEDAIDLTDWSAGGSDPFDVRMVILVTDAGPKSPNDPDARSNLGVDELRAEAERQNITLMTLHLRTPNGGAAQHDYAEEQYRRMTRFYGNEYYYGIPDGSASVLRSEVEELVTSITDIVRRVEGQEPELSDEETRPELRDLGLALQLAYLGAVEGTQAPSVVRSWVTEKAAEDPRRLAIAPRLLVTLNEMATMEQLIGELLEVAAGGTSAEDGTAFFAQIREVVSQMAQNPDRLVNADAATLGGALDFLEDLPYRSQFMDMTVERWEQSAMGRRTLIDSLRQKRVQYGKWLRRPEVWTALYEGAPDGEKVFAMPFELLP